MEVDEDEEIPQITLQEMMDDLQICDDTNMEDNAAV